MKKGEHGLSTNKANPLESLQGLAQGDVSVLDALQRSIESSFEESGLDPQTFKAFALAEELAEEGQ